MREFKAGGEYATVKEEQGTGKNKWLRQGNGAWTVENGSSREDRVSEGTESTRVRDSVTGAEHKPTRTATCVERGQGS